MQQQPWKCLRSERRSYPQRSGAAYRKWPIECGENIHLAFGSRYRASQRVHPVQRHHLRRHGHGIGHGIMERRRVRPRHPHQHRHRHHHRTESQTNARQAFHPRSLRLSRTTRRQGRRSAAQRNRARRPHVDPLRRTGSRRRADRAHLGPGTRRIHAHWRIAHRAQERRRRHLFRIHRGLRHGLGQGQRGRRAQLCRHLDRAGEGLQKDRVRPSTRASTPSSNS